MIVRFLRYPVKEEILRYSRSQNQLCYKGSPIRIYPDLSADLPRQRGEFGGIKSQLFLLQLKTIMVIWIHKNVGLEIIYGFFGL
uniref:Uncharacterized protein n=1 Tax=Seriola lalandi dorsalis TaxID=1841481 RepID=A0A3B4XJX6_SERLL